MMLINKACMTLIPLIGVFLSGEACEEVYQKYFNTLMDSGTEQRGVNNIQDCLDACTSDATCTSVDFDNLKGKCFHHSKVIGGTSTQGVDYYVKRVRCRSHISEQLHDERWALASTDIVSVSTIMHRMTVPTIPQCGRKCKRQECCVSFGVKVMAQESVSCLLMCSRTNRYGTRKNDMQPMVGYKIFDIQANFSEII